jgi:hypothetical protein
MIIRFLWNERIDAHEMRHRFQAQFDEHAYRLRTVQFWITEVRLDRQDLHDEICTGRHPLDDLDVKILVILDKSPFELTCSIAETLRVAHLIMLMHLYDSIGFRLVYLYWVPCLLMHDLRENEKSIQKRCCYSCMLLNVMVGIIL